MFSQKEYFHEYYLKNKQELLQKSKEYRKKNEEQISKHRKQYYQLIKEYIKEKRRDYYRNNKKKVLKRNKLWMLKNREKTKSYKNKWHKNNPEKRLTILQNSMSDIGGVFGLTNEKYRWALQSWTNYIQKRDKEICQICGETSNHSHHIFQKSFYPKLSLNINNGIALCEECHYETHAWRLSG